MYLHMWGRKRTNKPKRNPPIPSPPHPPQITPNLANQKIQLVSLSHLIRNNISFARLTQAFQGETHPLTAAGTSCHTERGKALLQRSGKKRGNISNMQSPVECAGYWKPSWKAVQTTISSCSSHVSWKKERKNSQNSQVSQFSTTWVNCFG